MNLLTCIPIGLARGCESSRRPALEDACGSVSCAGISGDAFKRGKPNPMLLFAGMASLCLLITGCVNQRIAWSPDGARAALIAGDGLRLCDPDGTLSENLLPGAALARWFPDSRRLVIAAEVAGQSWKELEKLLTPEEQKRAVDAAKMLEEQLKGGHSLSDGLNALTRFNEYERKAAVAYLAQSQTVKNLPEAARGTLHSNEATVIRIQIGTTENGKLVLGPTVLNTLRKVFDLHVSPGGTALSFTAEGDKEDVMQLFVAPVDGSSLPQLVARNTAVCPDWSPDGRSLVYLRAVNGETEGDQLSLGSLSRRTVLNADGKIEIQAKTEDLAGMLFETMNKVRCLGDGRIVFAAADVHLPCTALDMPQEPQLYVLDPQRQAAVIPLIPRGVREALPSKASFYEPSPDGKRIVILGEKGVVVIFTPATGELEAVQASGDTDDAPTWRSANELCFIAKVQGQPDQLAIWNHGAIRLLSTNWPAAAREGFLGK